MDQNANEPMDQLTAHLDRGWDLVSRGDFAGAMLSAEKSLELDEESPEAHNLLGYIFQAQGRPDEALEHYRTALDLDEGYVDALLNAADVMLHPIGDHAGALQLVDDALDWLEDDETDLRADALLLKVDIHLALGDHEAAQAAVQKLPDGPFENPQLTFQVGRARYDVGDVEGAEPLIRRAIDQRPPIPDAFYYLGHILMTKGDQRGALIGFLSARDLDLASPPPPWTLPHDQFEKHVRGALQKLPNDLAPLLEGALVVVTDVPGAEVVAEGFDPRAALLLDDLSEPDATPRVGRLFVYQRNVERFAGGILDIEDEIQKSLETELAVAFPNLTPNQD